jgi:hypothetical protein
VNHVGRKGRTVVMVVTEWLNAYLPTKAAGAVGFNRRRSTCGELVRSVFHPSLFAAAARLQYLCPIGLKTEVRIQDFEPQTPNPKRRTANGGPDSVQSPTSGQRRNPHRRTQRSPRFKSHRSTPRELIGSVFSAASRINQKASEFRTPEPAAAPNAKRRTGNGRRTMNAS